MHSHHSSKKSKLLLCFCCSATKTKECFICIFIRPRFHHSHIFFGVFLVKEDKVCILHFVFWGVYLVLGEVYLVKQSVWFILWNMYLECGSIFFGIWLGVFVLLYCKRTSLYFVFSLNICNLLWWKANLVWTSKITKVFVDTGELKVVPKWGLVGFITSNADKCATGRKSGLNRSESKHNTAAKHN